MSVLEDGSAAPHVQPEADRIAGDAGPKRRTAIDSWSGDAGHVSASTAAIPLRPWLLAVPLAVVAALPRLYGLRYMEFKADEAAVADGVRRMLETGHLIQVGIGTSIGVSNAPLFDYLMAIPFAISSDPRLAVAAIALANVGAVLVTFALGRRLWGTVAGSAAGLLFAVAPWGVAFSRKLWEQDLEPCFAAVCLYALIRAREGSAWWAAGAVACWLWMAQVHPSAVLLGPIFLVAGPAFWRVARRPPMLAGILVGVAPLAPYVAYELAHGWPNLHAVAAATGRPAVIDGMAWQAALSAVTGFGTPEIESVPFDHFLPNPAPFAALSLLATAVLLATLLLAAQRGRPGRHAGAATRAEAVPALRLLLGWLLIPVVLATRHSVPVYPHYELTALPAAYLLLGFAVALCTGRIAAVGPTVGGHCAASSASGERRSLSASGARALKTTRATAALLVLGLIVAGWAMLLTGFLRALPPRPFVWNYGVPYTQSAAIAAIGRQAGADGDLWLHTDPVIRPMLQYLLRDVPVRRQLPLDALVLPSPGHPAGYLIDDVHDAPVEAALQQAGATAVGRVVYMDSLHQAMAFRWPRSANADALASRLTPLPVRLANGVQFLGYGLQSTPALLQVEYVWRVDRVGTGVTDGDLALYTHLLAPDGKTVGQKDGMPMPSAQWRAGETIAAWFSLPLQGVPPGTYLLRAGMYRRPSVQRVARLDARGKRRDGEFALRTITIGAANSAR